MAGKEGGSTTDHIRIAEIVETANTIPNGHRIHHLIL